MTLYLLKVHLQTFLSTPITQTCQILGCDTLVANERIMIIINTVRCTNVPSWRKIHWNQQFYDMRQVSSQIAPIESVFNYALNRSRHLRSRLFARRSVFLLFKSEWRLLLASQYLQCQNLQSGSQVWESPHTGPILANKVNGPISLRILCPKISAQLARHVQEYDTLCTVSLLKTVRRWSCSLEKAWTLIRCLDPAHDALYVRELGA